MPARQSGPCTTQHTATQGDSVSGAQLCSFSCRQGHLEMLAGLACSCCCVRLLLLLPISPAAAGAALLCTHQKMQAKRPMCQVIMYSQKGESMDGPTGKCASSAPICWVNRPNRLWPPKALTGMLLGMVQLRAAKRRQMPSQHGTLGFAKCANCPGTAVEHQRHSSMLSAAARLTPGNPAQAPGGPS